MLLTDLDGTLLLADQARIGRETMDVLRALARQGAWIVPCTGRVLDMIPQALLQSGLVRYVISAHGARVTDLHTGETLFAQTLSPQDTRAVCSLWSPGALYAELASNNTVYLDAPVAKHWADYPVPAHHRWYLDQKRYTLVPSLGEAATLRNLHMEKLNLYGIPKGIRPQIRAGIKALETVCLTDPAADEDLEIRPAALERTRAIDALCSRLRVPLAKVMAIGDSMADAGMLRHAGLGVAMGNAPACVQAAADFVTGTNVEEGVAQAVRRIMDS